MYPPAATTSPPATWQPTAMTVATCSDVCMYAMRAPEMLGLPSGTSTTP